MVWSNIIFNNVSFLITYLKVRNMPFKLVCHLFFLALSGFSFSQEIEHELQDPEFYYTASYQHAIDACQIFSQSMADEYGSGGACYPTSTIYEDIQRILKICGGGGGDCRGSSGAVTCDYIYSNSDESLACTEIVWASPKKGSEYNECGSDQVRDALGICVYMQDYGKNNGETCVKAGNPINILNGNKFQKEVDHVLPGPVPYEFSRTYNSLNHGWTFSFDLNVQPSYESVNDTGDVVDGILGGSVIVNQPDGKKIRYTKTETGFYSDEDVFDYLDVSANEWRFVKASDQSSYIYDSFTGKINFIEIINGIKLSFAGGVVKSTTSFYPFVTIIRDANDRVSALNDEFGTPLVSYAYDDIGNLTKVIYADNTFKEYFYEDSRFPHSLTGMNDENNVLYASWAYDSSNRAVSSEHYSSGVSIERFEFDYSEIDAPFPSVAVTNPLLKETIYHFTKINNSLKIDRIEGIPTSNCLGADVTYTYYDNGLTETKKDSNNITTHYEYNNRGLLIKLTEAQGTPEQEITTTEWHQIFSLPTRIVDSVKEVSRVYDAKGNLIGQASSNL